MADLLGELETTPELKQQFEAMVSELSTAAAQQPLAAGTKELNSAPGPASAESSAAAEANFQETIRKTMERMQGSDEKATEATADAGGDDFLAEMMKAMGSGDPSAMGGEEDFSKMLLGMMEQLTNKEILYEPMKELHDKYPEWLATNAGSVNEADLVRYKEQQSLVAEIVGKFEEPRYHDDNVADREFIVERMQKVSSIPFKPCILAILT
jgi:peroxin-19